MTGFRLLSLLWGSLSSLSMVTHSARNYTTLSRSRPHYFVNNQHALWASAATSKTVLGNHSLNPAPSLCPTVFFLSADLHPSQPSLQATQQTTYFSQQQLDVVATTVIQAPHSIGGHPTRSNNQARCQHQSPGLQFTVSKISFVTASVLSPDDFFCICALVSRPTRRLRVSMVQSNPVISRAVNSRQSVSRACTLDLKF